MRVGREDGGMNEMNEECAWVVHGELYIYIQFTAHILPYLIELGP